MNIKSILKIRAWVDNSRGSCEAYIGLERYKDFVSGLIFDDTCAYRYNPHNECILRISVSKNKYFIKL
jgi:hypothetical protein